MATLKGALITILVTLTMTSPVTYAYRLQSPDDVSMMSQTQNDDDDDEGAIARRVPGWGRKRQYYAADQLLSHPY